MTYAVDLDQLIEYCSVAGTPNPTKNLTQRQLGFLMYCYGLIDGVRILSVTEKQTPEIAKVCFPSNGEDNADFAQTMVKTLKEFKKRAPQISKIPDGGATFGTNALAHAYPCK